MLVTMLGSMTGSEDGFNVKRFEKGQQYDMADMLARHWISMGYAVESKYLMQEVA